MLAAVDALTIPGRALADYGVVLTGDSGSEAREWSLLVEGPVYLTTSRTGMDGRGWRWFLGVWPRSGQPLWVAISVVKIYASGGHEGVAFLGWHGDDLSAGIEHVNADTLAAAAGSLKEYQPPGCRPLDEVAIIGALGRGERVPGPGWDELDEAALRGYSGHPPERWAAPGDPLVTRYSSDPRTLPPP